jgi:DUF218 domain
MPNRVATNIIVFGRGLMFGSTGIRLSDASASRAQAVTDYMRDNLAEFNRVHGRVVFTGGWAGAAEKMQPPQPEFREANLMLNYCLAQGIDGKDPRIYAVLEAEDESDSTLENVLKVDEGKYFGKLAFTADNPLGIIAHEDHIGRIDYLIRKVFHLKSSAILHIVVPGSDKRSDGLSEGLILFFTRVGFIGVWNHASLRRRHRILVSIYNALFRGRLS